MFAASAGYERFMGRWSRLLAPAFISLQGSRMATACLMWAPAPDRLLQRWKGHACEPRLSASIPQTRFVAYAQKNASSTRVRFEVGDAQALKFKDASFDHTLALLVMNFVPDHSKAIAEMRRVTRPGGVSACVWDYDAGMEMLRFFWDEAVALDPAIEPKDERHMKLSRQGQLRDLWKKAGLTDVRRSPWSSTRLSRRLTTIGSRLRKERARAAPTSFRSHKIAANSSKLACASVCRGSPGWPIHAEGEGVVRARRSS